VIDGVDGNREGTKAMLQIVREEVIGDLLALSDQYAKAGKLFHSADVRAIAYKLIQELQSKHEKAQT
jgi:hypothetical protein